MEDYKMEEENENKVEVNTYYDKVTKENLGVELPDGTIVLVDKKKKEMRFAFPREKFWEMFKQQKEEGQKYLEVAFSEEELEIISKTIGEKNGRK